MYDDVPNVFQTDLQRRNLSGLVSVVDLVQYNYGYYFEKGYVRSSKITTRELFSKDGFLVHKRTHNHTTGEILETRKSYLKDKDGRLKNIQIETENRLSRDGVDIYYLEEGTVRCVGVAADAIDNFDIILNYSKDKKITSMQSEYFKYTFLYDSNGRIVRLKGMFDEEFSYDEFGNILTHRVDFMDGSWEEQSFEYTTYYRYDYEKDGIWNKLTITDNLVEDRKTEIYRNVFYSEL